MFNRVYGESDFRAMMDQIAAQAEAGTPPSTAELGKLLATASKEEVAHLLSPYLHRKPNEQGILAAFLTHELSEDEALKTLATEYCLRCIDASSEWELLVYILFSSLEIVPRGFRDSLQKAVQSDDARLRVTAAPCALSIAGEFDSLASDAITALGVEVRDDKPMSEIKLMAAIGLAQCRVRSVENANRLLAFLASAPAAYQLIVVPRLHKAYGDRSKLIRFLLALSGRSDSIELRACVYRCLGHVCPDHPKIQQFLMSALEREKDPRLRLAIGLGLANQTLEFPQDAYPIIFEFFDEDDESRLNAALVLKECSMRLQTEQLETIAELIASETHDVVREALLRCFTEGPTVAIPLAMRNVTRGTNIYRTLWIGVLAKLCSRFPEEFFDHFTRESTPRLDEVMPHVLSGCELLPKGFLQIAEETLRDGTSLERRNVLMALGSVGPSAAELTPRLVQLYLHGTDEEKSRAESLILRFGEQSHSYLMSFDEGQIRGEEQRHAFRRLKHVVGLDESTIKDRELVDINNNDLMHLFVAAGTILEKEPATYNSMSDQMEEMKKAGVLPKRIAISANSILLGVKSFSNDLTAVVSSDTPIVLITGKTKRPRHLTDEGKYWLERCRAFLKKIGRAVPE